MVGGSLSETYSVKSCLQRQRKGRRRDLSFDLKSPAVQAVVAKCTHKSRTKGVGAIFAWRVRPFVLSINHCSTLPFVSTSIVL